MTILGAFWLMLILGQVWDGDIGMATVTHSSGKLTVSCKGDRESEPLITVEIFTANRLADDLRFQFDDHSFRANPWMDHWGPVVGATYGIRGPDALAFVRHVQELEHRSVRVHAEYSRETGTTVVFPLDGAYRALHGLRCVR